MICGVPTPHLELALAARQQLGQPAFEVVEHGLQPAARVHRLAVRQVLGGLGGEEVVGEREQLRAARAAVQRGEDDVFSAHAR